MHVPSGEDHALDVIFPEGDALDSPHRPEMQ